MYILNYECLCFLIILKALKNAGQEIFRMSFNLYFSCNFSHNYWLYECRNKIYFCETISFSLNGIYLERYEWRVRKYMYMGSEQ